MAARDLHPGVPGRACRACLAGPGMAAYSAGGGRLYQQALTLRTCHCGHELLQCQCRAHVDVNMRHGNSGNHGPVCT